MKQLAILLILTSNIFCSSPPRTVTLEENSFPLLQEELQTKLKEQAFKSLVTLCSSYPEFANLLHDRDKEFSMAFLTWLLSNSSDLRARLGILSYVNGLFLYAIQKKDLPLVVRILSSIPWCEEFLVEQNDTWIAPAIALLMQKNIKEHKERKSSGLETLFTLCLTKPSYHLEKRRDFSDFIADPERFIIGYRLLRIENEQPIACSKMQTPLMWAAMIGDKKAVETILKLGICKVLSRDKKKNSALDYAIKLNHQEIALLLIKAGAPIKVKHIRHAIDKGHSEFVKTFIDEGAPLSEELIIRARDKLTPNIASFMLLKWMGLV